eukprot:c1957_g1_i1.p1 GENE.c1957_g1_i1~~c1957_g1_i1.p1  ORF type:complete len:231 (+),score=48.48 c1957_g1_i1:39-695(+)
MDTAAPTLRTAGSVAISAGECVELPVSVTEPCMLLFVWTTQDPSFDIEFSITFKSPKPDNSVQQISPPERRHSHQATADVLEPGTYVFIFDNHFSYLRGKTVHYAIYFIARDQLALIHRAAIAQKRRSQRHMELADSRGKLSELSAVVEASEEEIASSREELRRLRQKFDANHAEIARVEKLLEAATDELRVAKHEAWQAKEAVTECNRGLEQNGVMV